MMGPTASGKSDFAEALADRLDAQLINADAFQIYRKLDIGTAKPKGRARYRLLDLRDPTEGFGLGEYLALAQSELEGLFAAGRSAIVVGGTGLYIRALFEEYAGMAGLPSPELRAQLMEDERELGLPALASRLRALDPALADRVDLSNPARVRRALERILDPTPPIRVSLPNFRRLKFGFLPNREVTNARIDSRLEKMVQNGWVDEVRRLVGEGIPREAPGLRAIGYRTLYDCVLGVMSPEVALAQIQFETRQYAKRQRTWLRSEPNLRVLPDVLTMEHALDEAMQSIISQ